MAATLEGWRAYATLRGNCDPDEAEDDVATAALQRASDYIRLEYVLRSSITIDSDDAVEAIYIAASQELSSPGFWAKTYTPAEARVLTGLRGISWTYTGDRSKSGSQVPKSTLIEALFRKHLSMGVYLGTVGNPDDDD